MLEEAVPLVYTLGNTNMSDVLVAWGPVLSPIFATVAAILAAMYARGARSIAKHTDNEVNNKNPGDPTLREVIYSIKENQEAMINSNTRHEKMLLAIQHSLHQNDARVRHILSSLATFEADSEGHYIWVSRKWTEYTGLALPDAIGRAWESVIKEEDVQRVTDEWYRAISNRESFGPIEYRIQHKRTKTIYWVTAEASPVRDSEDTLVGYVGSIEHIPSDPPPANNQNVLSSE
jgi:PAS domain S-box-containing protein